MLPDPPVCVAFMAKESNSKTTKWNEKQGAISQKWDGALQKWTDFMMPSGKCFCNPNTVH